MSKRKRKFIITCEMEERWMPQFLGMLKEMQSLGNIGSSRKVTFYADGDGDFHPKFDWGLETSEIPYAKPTYDSRGNSFFDAG